MKLIVLSGYQGSGKSEAARYLKNRYEGVYLAKFAGSVKDIASVIYNVPSYYWETDKNTKQQLLQNKTKREVLQIIGTSLRNNLSADIWIYSLSLKLNELSTYADYVVIDDLRFPNELYFIKQDNGIVVYINRNLDFTDTHESESHYELIKSEANFVINNTKDLDYLEQQLDTLMDYLNS